MAFEVTTRSVTAGDRSGLVYTLGDDAVARAEVWPTHGFNCLRWQVRTPTGWENVLYTAPDWDDKPVPTRSGHPVLFPFPNRMRDAKFTFEGTTYELPKTESTGVHAIHGFTPRVPWRVVDSGANEHSAWVTGEFQLSVDAPAQAAFWPADARLRLTYRLKADRLRVEAVVDGADGKALPFGLGYHPYFRAPGGSNTISSWLLQANVDDVWEAENNLPTGWKIPADYVTQFRRPRPIGEQVLDTLYTGIKGPKSDRLTVMAKLAAPDATHALTVAADESFRELLLFTPQHRQAVAIEPYTCATDAMNLEGERKIDAGWRILRPGETYAGVVEYRREVNS